MGAELRTPQSQLWTNILADLSGLGYTYNRLTENRVQFLARALLGETGEVNAHKRKTYARLLSDMANDQGGSASSTTMGIAALLAALDGAIDGGGGADDEYEGPLDIVSDAVVAYGQRALSAAMRGSQLYTLRRDSDDTTQSFSSDASTGAAPADDIVTFIGEGNDGFATVWRDQSGNGKDVVQATANKQPEWSAAGPGDKPSFLFPAGPGPFMKAGSASTFPDGEFTVFAVVKISSAGIGDLCGFGSDGGNNWMQVAGFGSGGSERLFIFASDDGWDAHAIGGQSAGAPTQDEYTTLMCRWTFGTTNIQQNTVELFEGGGDAYDIAAVGSISEEMIVGGASAVSPSAWGGEIVELIIYADVLSEEDCLAITQNQAEHYGISLPPEWLPDSAVFHLDFVDGQYYADGAEQEITDVLGINLDQSKITADGMDTTDGNGNQPEAIGPLLSDILTTFAAGMTVVVEVDGPPDGTFITVGDNADPDLIADGADAFSQFNTAVEDFDTMFAEVTPTPTTDQIHRIAFTFYRDVGGGNYQSAISVDGGAAGTDTTNYNASWFTAVSVAIFHGWAFGAVNFGWKARSMTGYAAKTPAELATLSALS